MIHIFIINPFSGQNTFADDLRKKLATFPDLKYFVFNTRHAGYETTIVKKIRRIFEGEKLRFYCCGGSGTMRNMLNGFDDLSDIEVAFFPCGLTNDFLKVFGKDYDRFRQIEELIYGDIIEVDYIKSNCGIALNTLSTGLDSNTLSKMTDFRFLKFINEDLPYTFSTVYSMFVSRPHEYEVTLDGMKYNGKCAEILIGNGFVFGGNMYLDKGACVNDGKGIYRLVPNKRGFSLINILLKLINKKYDVYPKYMAIGDCRKITIKRKNGRSFAVNQDGDLIRNVDVCEAEFVHKGLRLVVPKGVRV